MSHDPGEFNNQKILQVYDTVETQHKRVRRLTDSIFEFDSKNMYSAVRLMELGSIMRKEDDDTAMAVYKHASRRIVFSSLTTLGSFIAGIVVEGTGFNSLINGPSDAAGIVFVAAGIGLTFLSVNIRHDGLKMRENLNSVIKEARRQHEEFKKDL